MNPVVELMLYFVFFAISLYGLNSVNFSKLLYPTKIKQAQVLVILLAMALAYLSMQFLLNLRLS
jgi:uncharacterized integral membrane protein (TIGR02327 family)